MGTERQGHYSKARIFQVSQVIHGISICRLSHTHLCILVLYPGVTLVNALCIQLPLTSSFFYTCHLGLVSSFHHRVIFVPLSLSLSVCPSYYICNQEKHCLTLPYLTDPSLFTASLPAFFHLSFKAIISAV